MNHVFREIQEGRDDPFSLCPLGRAALREAAEEKRELTAELHQYIADLKWRSEVPETLPPHPFDAEQLDKRTPEENAVKREEFDDRKVDLKRQWEQAHDRPWPKYESDVYSASGKLIRRAGSDYDAHHIQPLTLGGENTVANITPLHADVHYDKQGIHAPDSPYSKLVQRLEGNVP